MSNYLPTRFAQELVARLRGTIAQYNVSQADLAVICDVSQSQFSKMIRGARPMTLDQVAAICAALDIDLPGLFGEVEEFLAAKPASTPTPVTYVYQGERHAPRSVVIHEQDAWARAADDRMFGDEPIKIVPIRGNVPPTPQDEVELPAVAREAEKEPTDEQ